MNQMIYVTWSANLAAMTSSFSCGQQTTAWEREWSREGGESNRDECRHRYNAPVQSWNAAPGFYLVRAKLSTSHHHKIATRREIRAANGWRKNK